MNYSKTSIIIAVFLFFAASFFIGSKIFSKEKRFARINSNSQKTESQNSKKQKTANKLKADTPATIIAESNIQESKEIINSVSTDQKIIALTFDADMTRGMERDFKTGKVKSWYNAKIIEELEKTQTPATLFLTGLWIKNYPDITKELAANPLFEIANHSYSHSGFISLCYKLPTIPDNLDEEEITKTENLLKRYAPNYKKYFRFPGLCYDSFDISEAEKLGYKIIGGNISGLDGFNFDTNSIVRRVISRLASGGIIILHMHGRPNAPRTADALPEIIRQAKEKGYEFVKISKLLNE